MNPTLNKASLAARGRQLAFTLIELLTVIAIIGILAAIIIPVTGRVRESAKQAKCLSNMRQIGVACSMYSADNKNRLNYQPSVSPVPVGEKWGDHIAAYMNASNLNTASATETVNSYFLCPTRVKSSAGTDYAINESTCRTVSAGVFTGVEMSKFGSLLSKKVYFIDSQAGGVVKASAFQKLQAGKDPITDTSGTYLTTRHSGKCNILFLDGHVRTLGFPPLPESANNTEGMKWLAPSAPAPDGA